MAGYRVLFTLDVAHDYFSDAGRCRLAFQPDAATDATLRGLGGVLRTRSNGFTAYAGGGAGGPAPGEQVVLTFNVRARDPQFALYSEGLAACETLEPGSAPTLVFDSERAMLIDPLQNLWSLSASTPGPPGGLKVRPDFKVVVRLVGPPDPEPRNYQIRLGGRAAVWKYLLIGPWAHLRPLVVDTAPVGAIEFDDPFADGFDKPPRQEALADGRTAIPVRSKAAIALTDHPKGTIRLVTRSETGARGPVLSSLPGANPANFAIERAGAAPTLVAEIYVPR